MEFKLLGPHVNSITGQTGELITSWQPPVVVFMGHNNSLIWMKNACPKSLFLARFYRYDEPSIPEMRDPIEEARRYAEWQLRMAEPYREAYSFIIGINEPPVDEPDHMKKLAEFECERMRILDKHGYKAAILSFGEGNPPNIGWLKYAIPAFQEGKRYGAVYARHSYGWPNVMTDAEWRVLRHRKDYFGEESDPHNWPGMPPDLRLPLVITETGLEGMIEDGSFPHGWNGHVEADVYMEQLYNLDLSLRQDLYVLGATVFCAYDVAGTWALYNINPQPVGNMALLAKPLYRKYNLPTGHIRPRGIDVSYAQSIRFRWKSVAEKGILFAFIRSSIALYKDRTFARNMRNSKKQGIKRAPYHYLRHDAIGYDQAAFWNGLIRNRKFALPEVVDIEDEKLSVSQVKTFLTGYQLRSGHFPMIYTSAYKWARITRGTLDGFVRNNDILLWVADWSGEEKPRLPSAWDTWEFWQTTSSGVMAGRRVDLNIFNGTVTEFKRKYGGIT